MLEALVAARAARRPVVLATRLSDGAQWLLPDAAEEAAGLREAAAARLAGEASGVAEIEGERWFLAVEAPAPRLAIVGAVHIAQSLAGFAGACGFAVTVIDPRAAFATEARFPGAAVAVAWPGEALAALGTDARTAVVALSHDPKIDDPALDAALRSEAFYVAALGSRRSHAARLERLRALGHGAAALARIRGPAGLAIGAKTAPEIALSIAAQLVEARRA